MSRRGHHSQDTKSASSRTNVSSPVWSVWWLLEANCESAPKRDPTQMSHNALVRLTEFVRGGVPIGADQDPGAKICKASRRPWNDRCLAFRGEAAPVVGLVGDTAFVTPVDLRAFGFRPRDDGRVVAIQPSLHRRFTTFGGSLPRALRREVPIMQIVADGGS